MDVVFYKLILILVVSFAMAVVIAPMLIPVLHRLKFGQEIREIGPKWHKKKSGTPTMGGIIFIIPVIVSSLIFIRNLTGLCLLGLSLCFGAIGFVDDYIKVVKKRNLGLTERQKLILQLIASILFIFISKKLGIINDEITIPFLNKSVDLGVLYIPFALFVLLGTTNAVNLTDGIDGLATSVTIVVALFFAIVSLVMKNIEACEFAIMLLGACFGFLLFNKHPARVFMGDTGSLFLGGAVCALALTLKNPIILMLVGGVYVIETASVIIQVTSFKLTKKRVFKMTPIHHHFEMCGWSENKIVLTSVILTAIFALIALMGGDYLG